MRKDEVADLRKSIVHDVRRLAQGAHSDGEKSMSILVDGFGGAAEHFAHRLVTGVDELLPDIRALYILVDSTREEKAYQRLLSKIKWQQGEARTINPRLKIEPLSFSDAEQRMRDIDFYFFMADAAPPDVLDRVERSAYNLALIDERRAALFGASDSTLINIVSSHPQILVQKAAGLSQADPRRFFGECQVDARRLRSYLYRELTMRGLDVVSLDDIDVHCGGSHDNPVALTHGARVRLRDKTVVTLSDLERTAELSDFVRAEPGKQVMYARGAGLKTSPTAQQIAEALFDGLKARVDGTVITAAVYDERSGIYLEGPVALDKLALPSEEYRNRMSLAEKAAVQRRVPSLEKYLDRFDLRAKKLSVAGWDALGIKPGAAAQDNIIQLSQLSRKRHYFPPPKHFPWGTVGMALAAVSGVTALSAGGYYALQHSDWKTIGVVGGLAALVGAGVAVLRNGDDILEKFGDIRDFVAEGLSEIPWRAVGKVAAVTGAVAGTVLAGKYAYDLAPSVGGLFSDLSSAVSSAAQSAYASAARNMSDIPWYTIGKAVAIGGAAAVACVVGKYVWKGVEALYEKAEDLPWGDIAKGLAVIGLLGAVGYGMHEIGQWQVRKQQEEQDIKLQQAQKSYEITQMKKSIIAHWKKDEPDFVNYVFGGNDEVVINRFKLNLADVAALIYTPNRDRGLFLTTPFHLENPQPFYQAGLGSILSVFYPQQQSSSEVVFTGTSLSAPAWRDHDTFDFTGMCTLKMPFDIGNWDCRLDFWLSDTNKRYRARINKDNTLSAVEELK